ncbi:MAG TPA: response regulator transcription factor [Candidatus Saccharimonadales bacterium]|jgi:two-component system copper resistance phosphate regulon response regulator CusR|nr:response regulator transcription factor [Candidatus Saccharimonadales bacterium]
MKLLLVEDNRSLAESLKQQLRKKFIVDLARTGEDGLRQIYNGSHDLLILDLNLPDMNGYDICRTIRESSNTMPILILTGIAEVESRVRLLNVGADDYLIKPFNFAELSARVNALLRRRPSTTHVNVLRVKDLVLDVDRRKVTRNDIPITLRRKEFDILEYLMRNSGRTITRAMILDHVWENGKEGWNNTVDVHIKHLRDRVDRPFAEPLIKTAYGIGYIVDDA